MTAVTVPTIDVVRRALGILRDGNVVLSDGDVDYLAADMLEILAALHDEGTLDFEWLPQIRYFAEWIVGEQS